MKVFTVEEFIILQKLFFPAQPFERIANPRDPTDYWCPWVYEEPTPYDYPPPYTLRIGTFEFQLKYENLDG